MPEVAILQNLTTFFFFSQQLVSCIRHQNVNLFLDLGPTVSSHHKHRCSLVTYKPSLYYYQHSIICNIIISAVILPFCCLAHKDMLAPIPMQRKK